MPQLWLNLTQGQQPLSKLRQDSGCLVEKGGGCFAVGFAGCSCTVLRVRTLESAVGGICCVSVPVDCALFHLQ